MFSFQESKAHNMLCMMLNLCYKTLGFVIQFIGKEKALQIVSEYDRQVFTSTPCFYIQLSKPK